VAAGEALGARATAARDPVDLAHRGDGEGHTRFVFRRRYGRDARRAIAGHSLFLHARAEVVEPGPPATDGVEARDRIRQELRVLPREHVVPGFRGEARGAKVLRDRTREVVDPGRDAAELDRGPRRIIQRDPRIEEARRNPDGEADHPPESTLHQALVLDPVLGA
jgi:hypothetical protein